MVICYLRIRIRSIAENAKTGKTIGNKPGKVHADTNDSVDNESFVIYEMLSTELSRISFSMREICVSAYEWQTRS